MSANNVRKAKGGAWMLAAYASAVAAGNATTSCGCAPDLLLSGLYADLVGTLVIFGFAVLLNNSSLYDPYWSLAPIALAPYWLLSDGVAPSVYQWTVLALIGIWGLRLTFNFFRGWPGLHHEDWRYVDFRNTTGKAYWLVSLTGIHVFPTLLVFLGMLGPYTALTSNATPNPWVFGLACIVTLVGITSETVADEQLRAFVLSNPPKGTILKSGLWAYSRHPNYFGELAFWWGMWLFGMASSPKDLWTLAGPLAMMALFLFASIPMIDKRSLERRPGYATHMTRVSALVPWFPRK